MSFDSLTYLIFLPLVYACYLVLNHRWQNVWLLLASYAFYGWWDVRFLFLIVVSTAVDYCCGLIIDRGRLTSRQYLVAGGAVILALLGFGVLPEFLNAGWSGIAAREELAWITAGVTAVILVGGPVWYRFTMSMSGEQRRKAFLVTSIVSNLTILGFFKYFDFFVSSAEALAESLGVSNVELLHLNIVLPVGISFYTFQTLSYSIGLYRGETKATDDFLGFGLFVAFFPQLVAGPIERASNLLPAILSRRVITADQLGAGCYLILLGLFKKIGIANGMAVAVDSVYNSAGQVSSLDVALATGAFAIQIYCDFSAYSDIARGSAKLFGFNLMRNFEQPYFSSNPSEFWRRWHISLSTWLRDYLYISLGGNRRGSARTYRNLMLTMLLGGLWHGAAWNFVLWGGYQGLLLCLHRYFTRAGSFIGGLSGPLWKLTFTALFFGFVCYGWLLFRATSLDQIVEFTRVLFFGADFSLSMSRPTLSAAAGLLLLVAIDVANYRTGNPYFYRKLPAPAQGGLFALLILGMSMGMSSPPTQFIYFQF